MVHTSEKGRDAQAESNASSTLDADAFTGQSSQAPENKSAADTSILLGPAERHRLLVEWNNTQRDYPSDRCLHHLFEDQAARTPDAVALVCGAEQLTYQELNERANRLAHYLRSLGIGPESLVGLWLEPSIDLLVGMLGILKAGGAYVPIDRGYPPERAAFMLEECQAPVLVTETKFATTLASACIWKVCLDNPYEVCWRSQSGENPEVPVSPDHLAYVIYTSGSTGRPKGALLTHRNVVRLFSATEHWFGFSARDIWTLFHSPAFDFSVWEIWGALRYGGKLVVIPYSVSRSPDTFCALLESERVTVLNQTPTAFGQFMLTEARRPRCAFCLRYVILGGEVLAFESLRGWFDRHGDRFPQIVNMYGITETTVHVTYRPLQAKDVGARSLIGVPIPDLRLYILDEYQKPVPVGVPGEIYIGGTGVARGYLRRPELTAQRFIPDSFSPEAGAQMYRSGDLARRLPDGDIQYIGRVDQQVKIRGHRIEPQEIESVLAGAPNVAQAVVLVREDDPADKRLVAYVVPQPGQTCGGVILRQYLRAKLPEYMVPAAFVVLDHLPLTTNGKVDRMQLPKPGTGDRESAHDADPPLTSTEKLLTAIWGELLGLEEVGVTADFFALGGHSLLTIKLLDRIHREFDVLLPLPTVLACPQIRVIAEAIDRLRTRTALLRVVDDGIPATAPPLFVPGWYLNNSDFLPEGQAMYVLPFPELGHDAATCRVECIAEECLETLRAVRPRGPYLLAGYSLAGLVAYEMAWRLRQQGEDVPLVALIDSCPSSWPTRLGVRVVEAVGGRLGISFPRQLLVARLWVHLNELAAMCWHLGVRTQLRALWKQMVNLNKRLKAGAKARTESPIRRQQQSTANGANESRPNGVGLFWPHVWATARFQPKRYDGKVSLMLSQTTAAVAGSRDAGWEPWAKDIESVIIPGDHQTCIREHRAILAAELAARCKAALGSPSSAH